MRHEVIGDRIPDTQIPTRSSGAESVEEPADSARNIAVIAIHGVGQHPCGASAEAVSTLLMSLNREKTRNKETKQHETESDTSGGAVPPPAVISGGADKQETPPPPYSGFVETSIEVPLRELEAPPGALKEAQYRPKVGWRFWRIFDERRGYLAIARKDPMHRPHGYKPEELRPDEPDRGEFAYQFMLAQVAGYEGDVDRNFQTVRLEGQRGTAKPATNVHIYDAHYSDLTKPQNSIVSFFWAFYQLLFHLASLSLLAVYWVETENAKADPANQRPWRFKSSISAIGVRFLTMWVPALNSILLAIGASTFIAKVCPLSPFVRNAMGLVFAAVLSLAATFFFLWRKSTSSPFRPFVWALVPPLGCAVGLLLLTAVAYLYGHAMGLPFWEALFLWCWMITAGLVLGYLAAKFEDLRPGAFWLTVFLYLVNAAFFLAYLLPSASELLASPPNVGSQLPTASLWAVQAIFGELSVCWIVCLLAALISWPLGMVCLSRIPKSDTTGRRARAVAAFRTGRFAFAVPAVLFMIVTTAFWAGIVVYGSDKLKAFEGVQPGLEQEWLSTGWRYWIIPAVGPVEKWIDNAELKNNATSAEPHCPTATPAQKDCSCQKKSEAAPWTGYLSGLLLISVTPGLPITIAAFGASLFLLVWAVFPSVLYELFPEWTKNALNGRMRWLGLWLTRGLDNIAVLTRILWFGIVPIPLAFFAIDWVVLRYDQLEWSGYVYNASAFTLPLIRSIGVILTVSATALVGFVLKYFTTILDAILDVDNYLRAFPIDDTPRARIAERCVSLLRYVAARRDDQGGPYYSKVVFVAHSLGSMVTTDLLRYLERSATDREEDTDLLRYAFREQKKPLKAGEQKLPIYVFSMGSPLRQLLNRFFPHLYWWVSDVPDNSLSAVGAPVHSPIPAIGEKSLPRADEMNVTLWTNTYRSGDYIGRSLWVGQWLARNQSSRPSEPPDIASDDNVPPSRREACIGLGAHTHYWDRSAHDVATTLDELILF